MAASHILHNQIPIIKLYVSDYNYYSFTRTLPSKREVNDQNYIFISVTFEILRVP